ncbi:MAG: CDP-diacylglycerol--serine O-phosphatidyltransferase [Bacteroidales bacterium]
MKRHIPNLITSLNLASGFIAIIYSINGDLLTASWLIVAAMVFDFFDGFSARALKAYSDVGKELDSLADVVSFGVAPGLLVFMMTGNAVTMNGDTYSAYQGLTRVLFMAIAAFMPVCAAIRLAVFNLDSTQSKSFKGLPTPANAIAVISVIFASRYGESALVDWFTSTPAAILAFSFVLSVLMVTRIPLSSLKFSNLKFRENLDRYLLVIFVVLLFIVAGPSGLPLIIPVYIIISLLAGRF